MKQPSRKKPSETKRPTGSTKITLTLPNDLLAVLDDAAALDNRTRSNLIAYSLHRLKEANPCLGEPRPPCAKVLSKQVPGPSSPCPRGYIRPCERKQQPVPRPAQPPADNSINTP